jgi:amidase
VNITEALDRWREFGWTRAVRAVDPDRIRAEIGAAPDGALTGTLFTVKDLFPVKGVESAAGSLVFEGHAPTTETPMIAALRDAGSVCFGKGVCAEFGMGIDTAQRLDGQVLHPFDPGLSPGGSSGGDAVAVATRMVDFAIGGDYGGSIRWPAQATGVLGLRFGVGRSPDHARLGLPTRGQQATYEVPGVIARDPGLARVVTETLLGPTSAAPLTRRLAAIPPTAIGPVRDDVVLGMRRFTELAAARGFSVVDGGPDVAATLAHGFAIYQRLRALTDDQDGVRALVAGREELLSDSTRAILAAAAASTADADPDEVAGLLKRADAFRERVRELLAGVDALVAPVAATGAIGFAETVELGGVPRDGFALATFARAVTLTGLPALSFPVGNQVSVQLIGADRGELMLWDIAAALAG